MQGGRSGHWVSPQDIAGYKLPRDAVFVDAVRRSPSGKPDYRWARDVAVAALEGSLTTG